MHGIQLFHYVSVKEKLSFSAQKVGLFLQTRTSVIGTESLVRKKKEPDMPVD